MRLQLKRMQGIKGGQEGQEEDQGDQLGTFTTDCPLTNMTRLPL